MVAGVLSLVLVAAPLPAQCPDGTPPPCGRTARTAAPPANSVAVLYLDNLSRDTADAFLADGLTEEIIIRLAQVPRLDVKSRYEVARVRHQGAQDPAALGRTLRAAYLVMGSVQRAGNRVRLRYEVFRTATRSQVAGDIIDMASADLLTVESDIARQVATAVTGQLLPAERARLERRLTSDPVAYEEYLRGQLLLNSSFDEPALRGALARFDRAIARDSSFAAAFAGTAAAWVWLADAYVSPREGYGQARIAAARALALDSSQALAYSMLGVAVLTLDRDAREAERFARRAALLNPRGDQAHLVLYWALVAAGRLDEGLEEARRAWQADSLFSANGTNYAEALIQNHRLDSAAALVPRLRAILPPADVAAVEGMLLAARGDLRDARHLVSWRYYGGLHAGIFVRALLAQGDTMAARATVDSMLAARARGYYNPLALAKAYAALGDLDKGIEWLGRAIEERTQFLVHARYDDELAPLRADPRYAALERQLRY
jgi:TolB-like protein